MTTGWGVKYKNKNYDKIKQIILMHFYDIRYDIKYAKFLELKFHIKDNNTRHTSRLLYSSIYSHYFFLLAENLAGSIWIPLTLDSGVCTGFLEYRKGAESHFLGLQPLIQL